MGRDFNTDPVRGRLVGLVRISAVSSELESQKATIQGFATKLSNSISKWYEDIDRKRSEYRESKVLPQLLEDGELGQYDWIIIDKVQRIGTDNVKQVNHFLEECAKRGVNVWSVSEGNLSKCDVLMDLGLVIGSHSEQKEQRNKAENVSRGQYNNAKTWKYNGGILPYALDRICVGPDGEERFRLVEDRREANPGYVRGSKQAGEEKYLQFYEVIFPNGHSEIRTDLPGIGEHDRYVFALSVRPDRLRVIPLIFEMFRDGFSRNAIAKHLTDTKVDLGMKTYWTSEHISKILSNPIYGGVYEWKKSTVAKYASIGPDGQYLDPEERRRGGPKQNRVMLPPEKRIRAEGTREDLRLVEQETIDAVNERLARENALASERQARMTRADSHYLQPLMVCGHCGGSMVGACNRTTHYSFYCSDRYEYRTIKGKPPCVLNKILVADVEAHLAEFLERYGASVDADLAEPDLSRFVEPRLTGGLLKDRIHARMWAFVQARVDHDRLDLIGIPNGLDLAEEYRRLNDVEAGRVEAEVEALREELKDHMRLARKFGEGTPAHELAMEEIDTISRSIAEARASVVPLDQQFDAAIRQAREIRDAVNAVQRSMAERKTRKLGEVIRKLINRIEVFSVENPHARGQRPSRLTDRVVFHPAVGEPLEFSARPRHKPTPVASIQRAREIYATGITLNAVARKLSEEGVPTATGTKWHRETLTRLLEPEIAARKGVPFVPKIRPPRKGSPSKDGGG